MVRKRVRPAAVVQPKKRQEYKPAPVVVVDLDSAKFWASKAVGDRAVIWADVVRRMEALKASTGQDAECHWWHKDVKPNPRFPGFGLMEVKVRTDLPQIRIRKRTRK